MIKSHLWEHCFSSFVNLCCFTLESWSCGTGLLILAGMPSGQDQLRLVLGFSSLRFYVSLSKKKGCLAKKKKLVMGGDAGEILIFGGLFLIFVYLLLFYEGVMNLYHGITESRSDAMQNGLLYLGGWLFLTVLVSGFYYYNKQEKSEQEPEHEGNVIHPEKSSSKKKKQT